MSGIVFGVGVGPGDPELMTLKAVRRIRESDVIAVPGENAKESVAYKIAAAAVPEIAEKELLAIPMPMIRDREKLAEAHREGAARMESYLKEGKNVVFLTLGDSTIYCTFSYLQHYLEEDGFPVELVNGIPSFCAAAAKLGISLTEWDEPMHIIPAVHKAGDRLPEKGTSVLMKSASHIKEVKQLLAESDKQVFAVENCGMPGETLYFDAREIPEHAGYFTLIIAKESEA